MTEAYARHRRPPHPREPRSSVLAVLIGLGSALVYGVADFFGGLASKRASPVFVTALTSVVGLVVLLPFLVLTPGRSSFDAVFWGGVSGITGSLAVLLLYAALAIGPMSILSPLTAVIAAVVPMTWGLAQGERLGVVGSIAIGGALVAIVLVGFVPERGAVRPSARGLLYATGSGVLIGAFFILIDRAPADSGVLPLVANRTVSGSILLLVVVVLIIIARARRVAAAPGLRSAVLLILACGATDALANVLILAGLRLGELSVMSVLAALYPAGTIALAAVVLRERIAPVQWVGLALALVSAALLALD